MTEEIEVAPYTVTAIANAYVNGLRENLDLTKDQCYMLVSPAYIDGQPELAVQVIPGSINKDEGGDSFQDGGALSRDISMTVVVWKRLLTDRYRHSENLIKDGANLLDLFEKIRTLFSLTTLGGYLSEPVKFVSETDTSWSDEELGVVRRDIIFSNVYKVTLPTSATL